MGVHPEFSTVQCSTCPHLDGCVVRSQKVLTLKWLPESVLELGIQQLDGVYSKAQQRHLQLQMLSLEHEPL